MKTLILQLEPHDDVISVRDKIGGGQSGRVVLVWPKHGRLLDQRLDLLLLQRHSASLGMQLALVTSDSQVIFYAKELGIPVFKSKDQAQTMRWRLVRRRKVRPDLHQEHPDLETLRSRAHPAPAAWTEKQAVRLGFFALGVLSLLAIIAMLLPGAKITLSPAQKIQESTLEVAASPSIKSINISGELPAHFVSVVVEGRDSITTTGTVQVPEKAASGYVRFTNLTDSRVDIPAGLVVATLGSASRAPVSFSVVKPGSVAAGAGQNLLLPVSALNPGPEANLLPGNLVAIEGPLGLKLTVNNETPTTGGSSRSARGPGAADYDNLNKKLSATLQQTALQDLISSLSAGDIAITSSLVVSDTLEKDYEPAKAPGQSASPADRLNLTLRLEFRALVVNGSDLTELSSSILNASLPSGMFALPKTLAIDHLTEPKLDKSSTARWRIHIQRTAQASMNLQQALHLAVGLPPEQASRTISEAMPLASPPRIELFPAWWPRLPALPFRITVVSNQ